MRSIRLILVAGLFALLVSPLPADNTPLLSKPVAQNGKPPSPAKAKLAPVVTPEREAAAMTFVEEHHPELAELLSYLKSNRPKDYERAVRDLFKTSERLATIHDGDFERYQLELELWKIQSRIQLLGARLKMSDSEPLRKQLREALNRQIDLRLASLERERDRTSEKLQKLDEQLQKTAASRDQAIERQMRMLTKQGNSPAVKANSQTDNDAKSDSKERGNESPKKGDRS